MVDSYEAKPMGKKSESTVELLKRALERKFSEESVSYVSFQGNHLELDLKGFLSSTAGRTALKAEVESAKRVPLAPVRKIVAGS